ncbi:MAG: AarF/UbiB family protein [Candidatus Latescibacterota bacterium]
MLSIRSIGVVGRTYRQMGRYRDILRVLVRYGFSDLVDSLHVERYLPLRLRRIPGRPQEGIEKLTTPRRLRMALEDLGPTFVKLGQILSTRPDLIPVAYLDELSRLQDQVPHFAYVQVREVIRQDTGKLPEELFARFDEEPLAAASIGQVHRARRHTGEEVVVKVQRPGIRQTIETDLEILMHLASLMERNVAELELHRPTRIVQEFARVLEKEIDYTVEASNLERFAHQFAGERTVYVPRVFRDLTTPRILTTEFVEGIKISQVERLREVGYDLEELARRGTELVLRQVFVHGFFHGDPHPGNVFILPDHVICYLDFGAMGRVSRRERELFADLMTHVARGEEGKAIVPLLQLTTWEEEPDRDELERDIAAFADLYLYRSLQEVDIAALLRRTMETLTRHGMSLRPNLFLMLRALGAAEGAGRRLVPSFEVARHMEPFVRRVQLQRLDPRRVAADTVESTVLLLRLLRELPTEAAHGLRQLREGRMRIQFQHEGLDPVLSVLDRISNRVAFAIVLAALIIGSSLMVLAGVPPQWHGIPVIGLAGFVVAGMMGFWLLLTILRRGRM